MIVTLVTNVSTHFSEHAKLVRQGGFSLLELLIVLLIAAALLALAGPAFSTSLQNSRLLAAAGRLGSDIALARNEASTRRSHVALCASADGTICAGSDWESGWIVFVDDGAGGGIGANGARDGNEILLKITEAAAEGVTIRSHNFDYSDWIMLQDSGRLGFAEGGTFVICDSRGADKARAINLNGVGHTRLATDEDGDGIAEDDRGAPTKCT